MNRLFVALLALAVTGCTIAQVSRQHVLHCTRSKAELVDQTTNVLSGTGYQITHSNRDAGVVQAEREKDGEKEFVSVTVTDSVRITMRSQSRGELSGKRVTVEYSDKMMQHALKTELEQINRFCQ